MLDSSFEVYSLLWLKRSPSVCYVAHPRGDYRFFALPLAENWDQETGGNAYGEALLMRPSLGDLF